jgi:hypothetical protein
VRPNLTAYRGKLLSNCLDKGTRVHAGGFLRKRRIVLESQLFGDDALLRLILTHELFHFVWPRLGNPLRTEFADLVREELDRKARGELGESAAVSKQNVLANCNSGATDRHFRHYVCEAFCDTGAFLYAGVSASEHFTLAPRWIARRQTWFQGAIDWESRCI